MCLCGRGPKRLTAEALPVALLPAWESSHFIARGFFWTKRRSGADSWVFLFQQAFTKTYKRLGVTFSAFVFFFFCPCVIIRKGFEVVEKNAAVILGKHPKTMVHCAGCERPILDRFLLNVLDRAWHIKCVQCCECKCNLTEKCFSREGKLYCKNDFFR